MYWAFCVVFCLNEAVLHVLCTSLWLLSLLLWYFCIVFVAVLWLVASHCGYFPSLCVSWRLFNLFASLCDHFTSFFCVFFGRRAFLFVILCVYIYLCGHIASICVRFVHHFVFVHLLAFHCGLFVSRAGCLVCFYISLLLFCVRLQPFCIFSVVILCLLVIVVVLLSPFCVYNCFML